MSAKVYAGLMSGTSLDAVDAVLVRFSPQTVQFLGQSSHPFPPALRTALLALNRPGGHDELEQAAQAGIALARCYADATLEALRNAGLKAADVRAIGCHGQTVRHRPGEGFTLQLGNGAWLAELTGITVVTDFRSRDVAAGGQGAPLVPAFHAAQFGVPDRTRVILNLGGISNLTLLQPGKALRGYDCGPCNVLLDGWTERHLQRPFDADGAWGRTGVVQSGLLEALLAHPYFDRLPPKSTGRDEFHLGWLDAHPAVQRHAPQDVQATLVELAARAAADCLRRETGGAGAEVYCCGGGARNPLLMERLQALLPRLPVDRTDALGLPTAWVEAVAFAWLARELLAGRKAGQPDVTGARHAVPLGAIYPA